jgi:hypothetical protein
MDDDGLAANPLQMQPELPASRAPKRRQGGKGRPYPKGLSGNPAGKRPGTRNRATIIAEEMLDCETRPLLRGAIEDAREGDRVMRRFCIARILPPRRERPVRFALPPIDSAADLHRAMAALLEAVARGEVTVGEAYELAQTVDIFIRAIDAAEVERRLQRLEAAGAAQP